MIYTMISFAAAAYWGWLALGFDQPPTWVVTMAFIFLSLDCLLKGLKSALGID
jgi:hypothetical protein